ncbi:TetR/AcrR family transcriptional regulator [Pseudoflavonifractor sp. An85]|uniref:TetR/AcrR family transcriptional regulator n=1 Tax=Pseudoflavonifractor sp. An85 TaxID=1965661 RepID=UPI000B382225|nr:TetR/AcrR family transcriptional regulator [Pseudoflavonifractor sp. An85]OUN24285.1 hypothetical protein B5G37_08310 [Pseudoflavonifractor sp. An85]
MPKGRPSGLASQKSEDTKQLLSDIAYRLFKEQGYDHVGVREIAAEAGMTTGAFYYYFKSKADILNHHAKMKGDWLFFQIPLQLEGKNPLDKIRMFLAQYLCEIFVEEGWELCESRMFARYYDKRESSELFHIVRQFCQEALEQGLFSPDCPLDEAASDIILVCRGVEYDWCLRQGRYDIHQRMLHLINVTLSHYQQTDAT